jgi:hypothetical protein
VGSFRELRLLMVRERIEVVTGIHFTGCATSQLAGLADSFVQPSIVFFVVVPSVLLIVVPDLPLRNPVLGFLNLRHGHLLSRRR